MEKTFQQSFWGKLILFLGVVIGLFSMYISFMDQLILEFILTICCSIIIIYSFLAAGIFVRVVLDEQGIYVKAKNLITPRELKWEDIEQISDDSFLGIHIFHLVPKDKKKKVIHIPFSISNHKCLLSEIVKKTPDARVDDSIKELIKKIKH